jgi:hypothetical protein
VAIYKLFLPDMESPIRAQVEPLFRGIHALDVPFVRPIDAGALVK